MTERIEWPKRWAEDPNAPPGAAELVRSIPKTPAAARGVGSAGARRTRLTLAAFVAVAAVVLGVGAGAYLARQSAPGDELALEAVDERIEGATSGAGAPGPRLDGVINPWEPSSGPGVPTNVGPSEVVNPWASPDDDEAEDDRSGSGLPSRLVTGEHVRGDGVINPWGPETELAPAPSPGTTPPTNAVAGPEHGPPPSAASAGTGFLSVNSVPWADVSIDGRHVGPTPLLRVTLTAGSHEVRVTRGDRAVSEVHSVTIREAETTRLTVDLRGPARHTDVVNPWE